MSITLMLDPNRAMPFHEMALPSRAKLRRAKQLPKFTMSRTDIENTDPNRARPTADNELPTLMKFRTESWLAKFTKYCTDTW
jgi:hypothetical protein